MKKILYILSMTICLLTSCGEKELPIPERIQGDWFCESTSLNSTKVSVYVTFTQDSFTLFQKIGEGAYRVYQGTYTLDTDASGAYILTGQYNDGTPWGAQYILESTSNDVLTLTAEGITETYTRIAGGIPQEVRNSADAAVKSSGSEEEIRFF